MPAESVFQLVQNVHFLRQTLLHKEQHKNLQESSA